MKKLQNENKQPVAVNDFFDEVLCINLKERADRRKETIEEVGQYDIEFNFFEASGPVQSERLLPGECGAFKSHRNAILYARQKRHSQVLILEDDVELCPDFNTKFSEAINKVPDDWDMIYFGGNHESEPELLGDGLLKCSQTFAIHCIGVRWSAYEPILQMCRAYDMLVPIDYLYAELHRNSLNVYAFSPALAFQRVGYSDIQQEVVDYTILRRGYNAGQE